LADTSMRLAGASAVLPRQAALGDFVALLKPRVMSLVAFTGLAGVVVAPGPLHPVLAFTAVLCIAIGAGAAGAINMWYERDIDALMMRTRARPLPAGRMDPDSALGFGAVLAVASVTLMALAVNWIAAALLAISIAFYVFVYTVWLKRRTPQNIVIGGAAGAFPPIIGWAAVTGNVELGALVMFALIFIWTPPHFWSLALYRADDYQRAGIPMLPVVAGPRETRRWILIYSAALVPLSLAPWAVGMVSGAYALVALVLGALFLGCAIAVWRDTGERAARRMFGFSIVYLFALFAMLMVDARYLTIAV
jgi:heme o synthase